MLESTPVSGPGPRGTQEAPPWLLQGNLTQFLPQLPSQTAQAQTPPFQEGEPRPGELWPRGQSGSALGYLHVSPWKCSEIL